MWYGGTVSGWEVLREWLPFLAGVVGGGSMLIGVWIAVQAAYAGVEADWQYAVMLVLCAACFLAGGGLVIISTWEA